MAIGAIISGITSVLGAIKGSSAGSDEAMAAEAQALQAQSAAAQENLSTWKWVFIGSLAVLVLLIVLFFIIKKK